MADIELVIKIPEDTYKDIIKNGFIYNEDNEVVTHAIKNGTPTIIEADKECESDKQTTLIDADDVWVYGVTPSILFKDDKEVIN